MRRCVAGLGVLVWGAVSWGQVTGSVVVGTPVLPGSTFINASAALGVPPAVVSGGAVTPFSPPFLDSNIVVVRPGGSLTLGLSSAVPVLGGLQLGVFSNIGLIDVSAGGTGVAGSPAGTFSAFPRALVSVSSDGTSFFPLGAGPVTFSNPTNRFLDVAPWTGYSPQPGAVESDVFKAFFGGFSDFSGKTYAEMLPLFGGSAGGTWLDLSASGLSSVGFVRFEVPAGADYRLVLDAVTAVVPEPAGAALGLAVAGLLLVSRRTK